MTVVLDDSPYVIDRVGWQQGGCAESWIIQSCSQSGRLHLQAIVPKRTAEWEALARSETLAKISESKRNVIVRNPRLETRFAGRGRGGRRRARALLSAPGHRRHLTVLLVCRGGAAFRAS